MQVLRCLPKPEIINLSVSLGRGGEACIYAIPSCGDLVAKVYHKPTVAHAQKLRAMLANPPENPTASLGHISIAWPQDLLQATDQGNGIIGFLMPRIYGMRPIIDFYNPKTRREHCPLFNYQYLLRTARNLAAAFAALHNSGYCVGDVNESNILVSDTALVTLVDTDSFQVYDPDQNLVYRCSVGKPEFTPPELQNKTFAQHDRQIPHDLFGLAVLIFQLLMEGTHPFSGIFQGISEPPPYEARIAAGHFTYSQKRQVPYSPTPIAPAWEVLHPKLQELFLRCFEDGHHDPQMRPTAQTWLSVLAEAEDSLITCTTNPQHRYNNHLDSCPWCERTLRLGGRDPFPSPRAVENREHLRPRVVPKRRYTQRPRSPQPVSPQYQVNYWQSVANPSFSPYQHRNKTKFYPAILCLLGFGLLGYLDVVIKFTRPYVSQNAYTQQTLIARSHKPPEDTLSFADYYKAGHAAYQIRDYDQAVKKFSQAIEQQPTSSRAYVNRGNARYNLRDYEGALKDYNQALEINPEEVKAFVNRGNARYMMAEYSHDPDREYQLAIADFNKAIGINKQEIEAYIRRGIVRSKMARYSSESVQVYQQAIVDLTQAIQLNASRAEAYFQRGEIRYKMAQFSSNFIPEYQQVIADFNEALKINGTLAKVYLKRGMIRYELTQYTGKEFDPNNLKAIEDLQTAAKLSLEQEDTESYQQALSSICVIIESQCTALLQSSAMWEYTGNN
ncbi:tetratricopeptide repeat protein [Nodularia spumigena CS-586/05]|uniref:tetratricopeptide repeat protein n=1 Tax=Nodularia spumigena TaxID=70799 RepID=UPI0023311153|nr:tetratricopeptide repeat protein [Nodularia spumigena]MDB9344814.1 tetratricopeptide repeat protein [Nodularia spumigena CS-588/06]MDB9361749.1 tetratricopeptide repeat protein [Nodularia spumigena CS-588/02]MDB9366079.1 tetratricopeptide repeat protein [Nodularia spumigena CS-588/02A10]MDB9370934.1 tetratricopeptide repeat protein [Nodularia spumigena CS-586/05]